MVLGIEWQLHLFALSSLTAARLPFASYHHRRRRRRRRRRRQHQQGLLTPRPRLIIRRSGRGRGRRIAAIPAIRPSGPRVACVLRSHAGRPHLAISVVFGPLYVHDAFLKVHNLFPRCPRRRRPRRHVPARQCPPGNGPAPPPPR